MFLPLVAYSQESLFPAKNITHVYMCLTIEDFIGLLVGKCKDHGQQSLGAGLGEL